MKWKVLVLATVFFVFQDSLGAQPGNSSRWVGVWEGQLEGKPGVTVTLGLDAGDLQGTIVFNVVARENGEEPRVIGHDAHTLTHVNRNDDGLAFRVIRLGDSRELHLTMKLIGDDKATLQCMDCGGPESTELNRIH
jgi:hypothetical protein